MNHNFKNKNANIFLNKLIEKFPNNKDDIEILESNSSEFISLEIMDVSYGKPLSISMAVDFDEITIGHEFNDHEHFCLFEGDEYNGFIEDAFVYIDKIYKG